MYRFHLDLCSYIDKLVIGRLENQFNKGETRRQKGIENKEKKKKKKEEEKQREALPANPNFWIKQLSFQFSVQNIYVIINCLQVQP